MRLMTLEQLPVPFPPSAVALGTFDGVHLGHRALLTAAARAAEAEGLLPCVYTFDVPPALALGGKTGEMLTTMEEKAALMADCGIDTVVCSPFDARIAGQEAEDFFHSLLLERLNARHIVIGFHYHFGRRARGDAALMEKLCQEAGISLTVIPPVRMADGSLISSSAVRACLANRDRRRAEEMLNRPLSPREEALLGGGYHE